MLAEPQFPPTEPAPAVHRIILAEDDGALRAIMARVLRQSGYDVVETGDGQALLHHLARCWPLGSLPPPDLVLADVCMPGPDGLRVMQQMRTWGCAVPFVLMTAFGDEDFHTVAEENGARAVLDKPFALDDLLTTVASALQGRTGPCVH